jgi:hypothetical protein
MQLNIFGERVKEEKNQEKEEKKNVYHKIHKTVEAF